MVTVLLVKRPAYRDRKEARAVHSKIKCLSSPTDSFDVGHYARLTSRNIGNLVVQRAQPERKEDLPIVPHARKRESNVLSHSDNFQCPKPHWNMPGPVVGIFDDVAPNGLKIHG